MKILITGPQGCGKTTQAKILAKKFSLCLVKSGDLVREKAKEMNREGRILKKALDKGELAEERLVSRIVETELKKPKCMNGFVIDGYPRSLSQLKFVDPEFDHVILLELSDEIAKERMLKRHREDDTNEIIKERLKLYHEQTERVLNYYAKRGILIKVDASKSIEETTGEILKGLKHNDC